MKSIFENACFGKAYKTRDGKKAIYHLYDEQHKVHFLFEEGISFHYSVRENGNIADDEFPKDIVSEWKEEFKGVEGIEPIYFELAENLTETLLQAVGRKDIDGHTATALWIKNSMPHCKEPISEEELDKLAGIEGAKAIDHFVNREQSKFAFEWADLVSDAFKAGYRKAMEGK